MSRIDETPAGILLAYFTALGSIAADGDGKNSPYTKAQVKAMNQPGRQVEIVFKEAAKSVKNETKGQQIPWVSSSITGDFYFRDKLATPIKK